jgi:hypothetical protein
MMALIRRLICAHREMIRSRDDDGRYFVVCSSCGYREELLRRTPHAPTPQI